MTHDVETASIFLIAERFGSSGGGEAIKGQQYAIELLAEGRRVVVFTHQRSVDALGGRFPEAYLRLVKDDFIQRTFWALPPLRPLLGVFFHLSVRRLIDEELRDGKQAILHYISPVSPAQLRFPPKGQYVVMGPLTGNIYYPRDFRRRMSVADRLRQALHSVAQLTVGRLSGEKRRADAVLVSGYERTRASLRLAGCLEERMVDVVDSGISSSILTRPRIVHKGANYRFVCSGRLVDHKGVDLAIRAIAQANPQTTLDIYGDGVKRAELESLASELGLRQRVRFLGWLESHEQLLAAYRQYRGYIFPSLAEANGIAMQEAMAVGLPVVCLRWGGPSMLADEGSALYIEPRDERSVVADIAKAIDRLAEDGEYADRVASLARVRAEANFTWPAVMETWRMAYARAELLRVATRTA